MPRAPRLFIPGMIYHVFARGNNRNPIFLEDNNYQKFVDNLNRFKSVFDYSLYAYCLLPNHFHLLIRINTINISKIMQVLMTAYTMFINKKYKRVGHLFQGRFQSIIVEKDQYLLQVQRYIHLNPVKAKIVSSPNDYIWSSYNNYFNTSNYPEIEKKEVLNYFSESKDKQLDLFRKFTIDGIHLDFDPIKIQSRGVLGSSKFTQKLTRVLNGKRP